MKTEAFRGEGQAGWSVQPPSLEAYSAAAKMVITLLPVSDF
jgi:hypothetical protein